MFFSVISVILEKKSRFPGFLKALTKDAAASAAASFAVAVLASAVLLASCAAAPGKGGKAVAGGEPGGEGVSVENASGSRGAPQGEESASGGGATRKEGDAESGEGSGFLPEKGVPDGFRGQTFETDKGNCAPDDISSLLSAVKNRKITVQNSEYFPVLEKGSPLHIASDFRRDSCPEYYFLFAEGKPDEIMTRENVSDIKNLYRGGSAHRKYLLAVYLYRGGSEKPLFIQDGIIILEGKGSLSFFDTILIDTRRKISGLNAGFVTSEGIFEEILTFDPKGSFSRSTVKNTISDHTRKVDIDEDGVIELIRYEQVFVDGSGAETFITKYSFDGQRFRPVKSINTVKDLRSFLAAAEEFLEAGNIERFINFAVSPQILGNLRSAGISREGILERIFYPAKKDDSTFIGINRMLSSRENSGKKIDFIFPEILENPFRFDRDRLYSFTTYVRVSIKNSGQKFSRGTDVSDNGIASEGGAGTGADGAKAETPDEKNEEIYFVRIYMAADPFAGRRSEERRVGKEC